MEDRGRPCHWFYMCEVTMVATACQALGISPADVLYRRQLIGIVDDALRLASEEELKEEGWQVILPLQYRM